MDIIFKVMLLAGLVKANRYFKPQVCAIIYAFGVLSLGFTSFNTPFWHFMIRAVLAGGVSWYMFYKLKEVDDWSERWFVILGLGGAVLLLLL